MKLYWSPNSPYARKVVVVTKEMQIDHCVELIETLAIPTKANEVLSALNPLTRIPTLQLDTGEILFDSSLICEYLDEFSDGGGCRLALHQRNALISRRYAELLLDSE